jgi:hypothetical protein
MSGDAPTPGGRDTGDELACEAAAELLDVLPAVLVGWAERLSFPVDVGAEGRPRFRRAEIEALRAALPAAHSVEGAISAAQRRLGR